MRYVVFCILCVFASVVSAADPIRPLTTDLPKTNPSSATHDPLPQLDRTILLTRKLLEEQLELRKEIQEYLRLNKTYKQNLEDRELSYQMIKQAHKVFTQIKELHIAHAFDQEFLSDLAFFSGIIERWEGLESLSTTD